MSENRLYETTFIVNAALEDQDIDAVVSKVTDYLVNHGGEIKETNKWGRKRLAYPINKKFNGYYVHLIYDIHPNQMDIIERFLVLEDTILRHLNMSLSEKMIEHRKNKALEERNREIAEKEEKEAAKV